MSTKCKECGCQCSFCNTSSLDLHHEIEVLKASLNQSRDTIKSLKSELNLCRDETNNAKSYQETELIEIGDKYSRLEKSHRHLEKVNHDLEDKILELVQQSEKEQQATMSIHEDLHKKLRVSEEQIETIIHEKDSLSAQCKVVLDLLKNTQGSHMSSNNKLISKEVFKLQRAMQHHDETHPVLESEEIIESSSFMPVSTFPPCAIMFDHSPKASRKQFSKSNMPRNASDSRLSKMNLHPTDLKLCSLCREVCWRRDVSVQTDNVKSSTKTLESMSSNAKNRIFDV